MGVRLSSSCDTFRQVEITAHYSILTLVEGLPVRRTDDWFDQGGETSYFSSEEDRTNEPKYFHETRI